MDIHWIFMALASLGRLGQRLQIHGYPLDIHGIGMTGTMWDPVFRVDWGNLQPIGYPWHWHPWVDWDPGQSSPFKADWDSVGQCEMDWDNAYPLDLHGIGIPG